jgi:putative inorganic carbon (HCO3(-)) transporter
MRDLIVLAFTIGGAFIGFVRPWVGVLVLAIFNYLNPQRYAWGFSRNFPVYFIVFIATFAGIVIAAKDREPFPWTRETKTFVLVLVWFTFTTFWSPDFPNAAEEHWIKVMKIYVSILPTFLMINSRYRLRWLIMIIALSFGLIGLKGGIFALGTGFNYRVEGPDNTFYGGNNEIALALNMVLPLIILCAKETENKKAKMFFYMVFFFSICSIISSWSRGGLLTLCAVLGAMVLFSKKKWLSVPLLLMALFVTLPHLPAQWTYEQDTSVQERFQAWHYAWDRALADPFTGGGFETWRGGKRDVHNAYLEIASEHGFVALALWLSLLFGTIFVLERIRRRVLSFDGMAWMRDYARAIQIALLGYAVGGVALGVAYWDLFYQLVAIAVVMKVMLGKAVEPVRSVESVKSVGPLVEQG